MRSYSDLKWVYILVKIIQPVCLHNLHCKGNFFLSMNRKLSTAWFLTNCLTLSCTFLFKVSTRLTTLPQLLSAIISVSINPVHMFNVCEESSQVQVAETEMIPYFPLWTSCLLTSVSSIWNPIQSRVWPCMYYLYTYFKSYIHLWYIMPLFSSKSTVFQFALE